MKKTGLKTYIEANKKRLVELTKELVRIPTVNPPGENYEKMASLLDKKLTRLKLKTKKIETPKRLLKELKIQGSRRINLLAELDAGAKETVHINGHYDVVPPTGSWKTDPFEPKIKAGRIYGRGTEDMKGNIAAIIVALEAIKACGLKPAYNIQLSFTPDEETGGRTGFGYLVDKGYIKGDFGIGEGLHNDFASYGNKGILWIRVEVLGRACHACEPHRGINSFEKMVKVANELIKHRRMIGRRKTSHFTKDPSHRHATMSLGGELWGGHKINIVPDISAFSIDRRLLPEETVADVKRELQAIIDKLKKKDKDLKVRFKVLAQEPAVVSKRDSHFFKLFSDAVKKVNGKRAKFAMLTGATDMRFLIRKGMPCVGYSIDGDDTCHGDDEYIRIKSLVDTAKVFALFLTRS